VSTVSVTAFQVVGAPALYTLRTRLCSYDFSTQTHFYQEGDLAD